MSDLDLLIRSELDLALPLPAGDRADWGDVLGRAGLAMPTISARRRPTLSLVFACAALAVAAVAVATPVGSALARGLDGFSSWLTGEPGSPASQAEQQAFQQENARSWSSFPPGTELRRLIETTAGGTTFTLLGFRSGDTLCLRLVASGAVSKTSTHCAPTSELQQTAEPALVVAADEPFGEASVPPNDEGYIPELASATFGIASDGVSAIAVHGDSGTHRALVGSNAFLFVADHPKLGERVRAVDAVAGNGSTEHLPFASAPFGTTDLASPPSGSASGPTSVERHISGGEIGWLDRQETRGEPLPARVAHAFASQGPLLFGRVVQPDPGSNARIAIGELSHMDNPPGSPPSQGSSERTLCIGELNETSLGMGCSPVSKVFAEGPISFGMSSSGSSQFQRIGGLATDDVAKIRLFLGTGSSREVPLADNAYVIDVNRSAFPIRLVAYDAAGRIIYVKTMEDDGMTSRAPKAARDSMRARFSVAAPDGTRAVVTAGDPAGGFRCWQIRYGLRGASEGGCTPWPLTAKLTLGNPLNLIGLNRSGDTLFLGGQVPDEVTTVRLTLADGSTEKVETHDGFALVALDPSTVSADGSVFALRGYNAAGDLIAKRGIGVKR